MGANGNGNGHSPESPKVPGSSPGGPGTSPAPTVEKKIPPALEKNKYKPGQSGNPKGRKPGTIVAANAIHTILTAPAPRDKRMSNLAEWQEIAKARARKGDWRGAEILFNKWAPDLKIPDQVSPDGAAGGVDLTLNLYERMVTQTEPRVSDRPSFDREN